MIKIGLETILEWWLLRAICLAINLWYVVVIT
jgi:hypothetical protein